MAANVAAYLKYEGREAGFFLQPNGWNGLCLGREAQ